jgi:uncharacterized protein DUF6527
MLLSELEPKLTSDVLTFDCPVCKGEDSHRIRVPLKPRVDHTGLAWDHSGDLENMTLHPSVNAGCWHGHVTNGEIKP